MNSVGIDVPKRKSMIAVMRPSGEEGVSPIENQHTDGELSLLRGLPRETCVVMESTGNYHLPVAWLLNASGFYASAISAALVPICAVPRPTRRMPLNRQTTVLATGLPWRGIDTRLMHRNCCQAIPAVFKS